MKILYYCSCTILLFLFFFVIKENTPKQYVMLSASEPYIVYIPLIIIAWNQIGFNCIIVLVYHKFSAKFNYVRRYISRTNSIIIEIKLNKSIDINNVSRLGRIFAFINQSFQINTLLMTADVDILPINRNYFKCQNASHINIKSFGLNGYGEYPANKRWAMSYIMMTLQSWNELLRKDLNKCNSILSCVKRITEEAHKRNVSYYGGVYRRIDEIYMRDTIRNSDFFPSKMSFTLHKSYDRIPCYLLNKTKRDDIHLPRIKDDEEWIIYIYCIIKSYKIFKNSKAYIIRYLKEYNSTLYELYS